MRAAEFILENFADGRHPEDKGDSKRLGVPTKSSVSSLRKYAKSHSGRKAQLAHWMANMKAGLARGFTAPRVTLQGRDASLLPVVEAKAVDANPWFAPFLTLPATIPADRAESLRQDARAAITADVASRWGCATRVLPATDEEIAAHAQQLADIDKASRGKCLWKKLEETPAAA